MQISEGKLKKAVLKYFSNVTGKNLCQSLSFKKDSDTGVFLSGLRNF